MGLRLLGLWNVVFIVFAVVTAAQDCPTPVIKNGFYKSEHSIFSHNTELYYGCDVNFKPVEGSWWASVVCQNGNWSSLPQCIEDTACFDPEIPNANNTGYQYVKDEDKIWIRCNTGYEDKKNRGTAICQKGRWTTLPSCEKKASWCGPPPPVSNAVIVNQVYKDLFPEEGYVEYVCKSGFEMETNNNKVFCSHGQWLTPPSCRQKQEQVILTTTASPISSGSDDNNQQMFTTIDKCGTPLTVKDGDFYRKENHMSLIYKCNYYYKLKGNSIVKCFNGNWTPPPTCEVNHCKLDTSSHPSLENIGNVYIKSGTKVKLDCVDSTWRTAQAVCRDNQLTLSECCLWTAHKTKLCEYVPVNPSQ